MNKLFTLSALVVFALAHVTAQAETTEAAKNFLDVSGLKTAEEHKVWGPGMMQEARKQAQQQQGQNTEAVSDDPEIQKIYAERDDIIVRNRCERFFYSEFWGERSIPEISEPKNPRLQLDVCLKLGELNHQMYRDAVKSHLAKHPENEPLFKDYDKDWKD